MTSFLIASTFTDSLARLTADEQKAVKTTAFDLQVNAATPSMKLHRLDRGRDKDFWSARVSEDLRIIVHRAASSLLLCFVGHHDRAYAWAERRKVETHPTTGAAQIVEVRETIQEIVKPIVIDGARPIQPQLPLFHRRKDDELLGFGVPVEWLPEVRRATEETLLDLAERLPAEAAEALLELATGGNPSPRPRIDDGADPFAHPDAQRRFRVMANQDELARALEYPWDKWTVFLHPDQRTWVERTYNGPARVSGSAGTGKTIVALHRAVYLTRKNPDARVLLTTFSDTLADALSVKLRRLVQGEPRLAERVEVLSMSAVGRRLAEARLGGAALATDDHVQGLVRQAAATVDASRFTPTFLWAEWRDVVDAWNLRSWEEYRDVRRLGRKTRLPESQRATLWAVYETVRASLAAGSLVTVAEMYHTLAAHLRGSRPVYDFAVVDEAQDVSIPQLRFLAALGGDRPEALFFAGDLGQRIFQQPFSWVSQGVDVRGRARTLHVNYRTSHQIRTSADRLLASTVTDVDGNAEDRKGTVSVFNGPPPDIRVLHDQDAEADAVAGWLSALAAQDVPPEEIGVFVRSGDQIERAQRAVERAGLPAHMLDRRLDAPDGHVSVGTMHLAKGLEFRAVAVMACDDEVIPLSSRIEAVGDEADLEEVFDTERHLLYVACTRARDHLLVTCGGVASEFLDDLLQTQGVGGRRA